MACTERESLRRINLRRPAYIEHQCPLLRLPKYEIKLALHALREKQWLNKHQKNTTLLSLAREGATRGRAVMFLSTLGTHRDSVVTDWSFATPVSVL